MSECGPSVDLIWGEDEDVDDGHSGQMKYAGKTHAKMLTK